MANNGIVLKRRRVFRRSIFCRSVALAAAIFPLSMPAFADSNLEGNPASWRMQDYENGSIVLWYTGSSCNDGQTILPTSTSTDSHNRLWSLVLTASATGQRIGFYYDPTNCYITSFYST